MGSPMKLSGDLPDDVTIEILSRLPAKSLVRFNCVSKSWIGLVGSPNFIAKHRQTRAAISINDCVLVKRLRDSPTGMARVFSLLYSETPLVNCVDLDLPLYNETPRFIAARQLYISVEATCDGIFCLSTDYRNNLYLWNPSIREFKALPTRGGGIVGYGLGFDSKSNDYKLLRLWSDFYYRPEERVFDQYSKAEVYTLSGHSWREIDTADLPGLCFNEGEPQLYLKGLCYWRAILHSNSEVIVSFDMAEETFRLIPLPDAGIVGIGANGKFWKNIAELKESIALLSFQLEVNKKCFEVWLMRNDGVSGQVYTWSKYMTIEVPLPKLRPLGFWKKGELLLRDKKGNLIFYNISTGKIVNSGIKVENKTPVIDYNESLVSINGGN